MEETIETWAIKYSKLLQSLEGMEILSPKLRQEIESLGIKMIREEIAEAQKESDRQADELLAQSEYFENVADQFLDALGGFDKFGEHSNLNSPYQNAIDSIKESQ